MAGIFRPPMKAELVYSAAKMVGDPHKLVNMISKRVRKLGAGHRPLVDPTVFQSLSDTALQEVIEEKIKIKEN